jgi:signal transduction histidine kinase
LQEKHSEIHDLAGKLLSAQEDERRRLARELHDDFSQRLALLSVGLQELNSGFSPGMEQERALASALHSDLQDLAADVHDLSHRLHSHILELHGLEGALKNICSSVSHQHRIAVEVHSDGMPELPGEVKLCLFRVAQEAISNALKHGHARRIDVFLRRQEDCFSLQVRDDGIGFDLARPAEGLGLASMRERVRFVGGRLEIKSHPDEGTELNATVPLIAGASS